MKIHGKKIEGPGVEIIVIPRSSGDLIFKAQAVLDYTDYDKMNPQPNPPTIMKPGGATFEDVENKGYVEALDKWSTTKYHWMFLKSIQATEGLEWETVDMSKSETWENYQEEMKNAGLAPAEVVRIQTLVIDACGLNQSKIDEATQRFLAGAAADRAAESSQNTAPKLTPSGEPASVST